MIRRFESRSWFWSYFLLLSSCGIVLTASSDRRDFFHGRSPAPSHSWSLALCDPCLGRFPYETCGLGSRLTFFFMQKTVLCLLPVLASAAVAQTTVGPVTITGFADAYYSYEFG